MKETGPEMLNKLPEVTQPVNSRSRIRTQVSRLGSEAQNPAPCSSQDARSKGQSFSEEPLQELGCRELHRCLVASKTAGHPTQRAQAQEWMGATPIPSPM